MPHKKKRIPSFINQLYQTRWVSGYLPLGVLSFTLASCKFISDSVGYTESFSAKRSAILRVWLTAILWLLVLRLDCPWTLPYQGRTTVNFKDW